MLVPQTPGSQKSGVTKSLESTSREKTSSQPDSPHPRDRSQVHVKVYDLLERGAVADALKAIRHAKSPDPASMHLLAVCLLRNGEAEEAVRLYRQIVVTSGGYQLRREAPIEHKTSFAAALLQSGRIQGAEDVLYEIGDAAHPAVVRLRRDIRRFRESQSLLRRIVWKCGLKPEVPVPLTEPMGDLA